MPPSTPQHVFVTGASGFVGSAVVAELLRRGHAVTALSRTRDVAGATTVRADIFDTSNIESPLASCTAVVHLVGIIGEQPRRNITFERIHVAATRQILTLTRRAGIRRYLHMSALGTRENAASRYHQTKWTAEQLVRAASLDFTIFRPSMIHGPRGEFMRMAAAWARGTRPPYLFLPYFSPAHTLQPVFVDDVARAFTDALDNPRTLNQTYDLAGPDVYPWPDFLRLISNAVAGRAKPAVGIPAWYAKFLTRVVPAPLLPFNRDQVLMSQEHNTTTDLPRFIQDFGWTPAGFQPSLATYATQL